jgi:DNA-binding transcriptional ArsR family regulator
MPAGPRLRIEVEVRPALELLIGLSAATSPDERHEKSWVPGRKTWSPELQDVIAAVGERSGEAWLHLLGLGLELPARDQRSFVEAVARVDALELRRHLVGVYVPAWEGMVGADTLARAAKGNPRAVAALLEHPRYYAGRAAEALSGLLELSAKETKRRLVAALRHFGDEAFTEAQDDVVPVLEAEAESVRMLASTLAPHALISAVTRGYLYEPEPEFERVVLVPHVAARPLLLLCQHRDARVICYPVSPERLDPEESLAARAVRLGRALGDERRLHILRQLAAGDATLDELAEASALARSTAHHHLGQLRAAGLVSLRGNARGYWYSLRQDGLTEAQGALAELAHAPAGNAPRPAKRRSAGRPKRAP